MNAISPGRTLRYNHRVRTCLPALILGLSCGACPLGWAGGDAAAQGDVLATDGALDYDVVMHLDARYPHGDVGPGCGEVPATGTCTDAGFLEVCASDGVEQIDCGALGLSCGPHLVLGGVWCLAGPGQGCDVWPCQEPLRCGDDGRCEALAEDAGARAEDR